MYKSGLIFAAAMFVVSLGLALLMPYCIPCVALLLGLAAGYSAGAFGKPKNQPTGTKSGVVAGAIAGAGMLIGQMIGSIITSSTIIRERIAHRLLNIGFPGLYMMDPIYYWPSQICMLLFSVVLMAGMGYLGGQIWWNAVGNKQTVPPPVISAK